MSAGSFQQWAKHNDPFKMSASAMILAFLLIVGCYFMGSGLSIEDDGKLPWVISSSCILLYALFSSVGLMMTDAPKWFWSRSLYGYIGLVAAIIGISWLITGMSLGETGDFKSILVVLTIAYVVLMVISNTVRLIVKLAKIQDQKRAEKYEKRD